MKKRVVSGIKPSGEVTLGNYLGAMKRWAEEQTADRENFYFVPNLHALTSVGGRKDLKEHTLSAVAWLLAIGVDPKASVIFVQSQIPVHAELTWILNNFVTMGELSRMTQFKDKAKKSEGELVGLFDYPVLMAADILLYDADEVPVGEDQVQHVELTRDIARRFNHQHGEVFKLPKPTVQKIGARIMNLQDPARKMSATDPDTSGVIFLTDPLDLIQQKIVRATTDSGREVKTAPEQKPGISNLLQIYSLVTGKSVDELEKASADQGYAEFKQELAEALLGVVRPLQERYQELISDQKGLEKILEEGRQKASLIAQQKLKMVKNKLDLI